LQALLTHSSVSVAAQSVGRTQSAMSHSLARLRQHFHDPLLVRDGWAMNLTPFAEALRPQVTHVAHAVNTLFDGHQPFDPTTSERAIRIATRDICVPLLTPLIASVAQSAPRMTVEIQETTHIRASVATSEADIGFGFGTAKQATNLNVREVGRLSWCVFAPEGHPYAAEQTAEVWAVSQHILVGSPSQQTGPIEAKVAELGLTRHVLCYAPNFNAALALATDCDAIFTTLEQPFCRKGPPRGLHPYPMPFEMPEAPAILTLRRDWGNPFELWLASLCGAYRVG
jgi:DNA-binding transcriptional LysR family regulator